MLSTKSSIMGRKGLWRSRSVCFKRSLESQLKTLLHTAVMKADEATIEILIDLGAEITKENIQVHGFFVKVERVKTL